MLGTKGIETNLNIRTTVLALLLVLSCNVVAAGENYRYFPGAPLDEKTLRAQDRVEELYENGDYARALMICEEDLAPTGDKYAQYMIGFMYQAGQGVPQDPARALAWYRLAAERGEPALVKVRDALFKEMSPAKIAESNRIFVKLWKQMGDSTILLGLIRKDIDTLRNRTGSRIPGAPSGPITVIDLAGRVTSDSYYTAVEQRLRTRMAYLKTSVEISDIEVASEDESVKLLEAELKSELASLELP
jgi:TPR repeat protein